MRTYVKHLEAPILINKPNDPTQHHKNDDEIVDDDIAELFAVQADAQSLDVPAALDDRIRSMARAELEQGSSVVHINKSFTSRFAPMFATAAVLVLAVALVPMLVDQSTSPTESAITASDSMTVEPQAEASLESATEPTGGQANQPVDMSLNKKAEPLASDVQASKSKAERKVLKQEQGGSAGTIEELSAPSDFADTAATLRAPSAVSTLNGSGATAASSLLREKSTDASEVDGDYDYRTSQAGWLDEINRLFDTDNQGRFLYELTLFKNQYPKIDLSRHLPADALKLDSNVGEQ